MRSKQAESASTDDIELGRAGLGEKGESNAPLLSSAAAGNAQDQYDSDDDESALEEEINAFESRHAHYGKSWRNLYGLLPQLEDWIDDPRIRDSKTVLCLRTVTAKEVGYFAIGLFFLITIAFASKSFFRRSQSTQAYRGDYAESDVFNHIDPMIGTAKGGHVFPGANMPYGMVKAVADCHNENSGGYSTSEPCNVVGFSHMHDSGTGGATSFGNFPLFPFTGIPGDDPKKGMWEYEQRKQMEVAGSANAKPGYFGIKLANKIKAEMTATDHAALYRFRIPSVETKNGGDDALGGGPAINVDIRDLYGSLRYGAVDVDPKTGRMTGWGQFQPSFGPSVWRWNVGNHDEQYTLYFCADYKGAAVRKVGIWHHGAHTDQTHWNNTDINRSGQFGAYAQFEGSDESTTTIMARVGMSFISTEKACQNGEKEIADFDFTRVRDDAETAWRQKFANIHVNAEGVNESMQTAFWSGIYRTMISPQDYTGENPLWKSDEPYYDSFYCIWDSFRSTHPFLTIVDPEVQTKMVRTLLDIYKHEGKLPDCRMSLCKGNTQGGSNADVVIADALIKNITDGIDWDLAYEAVVSDAEDEPADWSLEGRGNLESWKTKGYIPIDDDIDYSHDGLRTRSLSRSLEYAYDDYCIATMAKQRGNESDFEKYLSRSQNWRKLFDSDLTVKAESGEEFKGFAQPKQKDGKFRYENPDLCNPITGLQRPCYLFEGGHSTYEGGSWLYSFYVPHDMASLISSMGGNEKFVRRLAYFHESGIADISDEQSFLTVFLYHYAGRPGLSSKAVHRYIPSQFRDGIDGIPGNDDSGSMGSFLAFCMMGFFPNPGQDVYMLTAPFFRELSLTHPTTKKTATIKSYGWDADYKNIYIQSVKLNGKPYTKNWITHSFFVDGGLLEVTVADRESGWGTGAGDIPPSLSTMK